MIDNDKYTPRLNAIVYRPDFARNNNKKRLKSKWAQQRQKPKTHTTRVLVLVAKVKQWRGSVFVIFFWMAFRIYKFTYPLPILHTYAQHCTVLV